MDNYNNTPISRKNKHLNDFERGQIAALYNEGFSAYAIGKRLKRASNTIRNELKRGTITQIKKDKEVDVYYPDTGHIIYENNRKNCGKKYRFLECEDFLNHVINQFKNKKISLDAIVGRSLKTKMFRKSEIVCTKTLYNYLDLGLLDWIVNTKLHNFELDKSLYTQLVFYNLKTMDSYIIIPVNIVK